jgi:hypothetical protein
MKKNTNEFMKEKHLEEEMRGISKGLILISS